MKTIKLKAQYSILFISQDTSLVKHFIIFHFQGIHLGIYSPCLYSLTSLFLSLIEG